MMLLRHHNAAIVRCSGGSGSGARVVPLPLLRRYSSRGGGTWRRANAAAVWAGPRRPASAAVEPTEADAALSSPDTVAARLLLGKLALYTPRGRGGGVFGDGPASLGRLVPYRRLEFDEALRGPAAAAVLASMSLRQLAGVASALAAAGHSDAAVVGVVATEATSRLRAALGSVEGAEWGPVCHLALAFARLRVRDAALMEAIVASATCMLEQQRVRLGTRRRVSQLVALLAGCAALRVRSGRLLAAAAEALKQRPPAMERARGRNRNRGSQREPPAPLALLGPWENVLLVWALARLEAGEDAALWTLLLERATMLVGQLPRHDICRAYCLIAGSPRAAAHAPLLLALRRALRQRLNLLKPPQLVAVAAGLAGLVRRAPPPARVDLLLADELARWVHHKARNFSPSELAATLAALASLRYRNPWLLGRLGRALAATTAQGSRHRLRALSGRELATVAAALVQLQWRRKELLGAIAGEAAVRLQQQQQQTEDVEDEDEQGKQRGNASSSTDGGPSAQQQQRRQQQTSAVGAAVAAAAAAATATAGAGPLPAQAVMGAHLTSADAAIVATSLAALRYRHNALLDRLSHACAGWPIADRAAAAWACAAVGHTPSSAWMEHAVSDAADAVGGRGGLSLLPLLRLAWAALATNVRSGGSGGGSGNGGGSSVGTKAAVPGALVQPMQEALANALAAAATPDDAARALLELGPELAQVAEAVAGSSDNARQRSAVPRLLPDSAVENAYAAALVARATYGPRGRTLRSLASDVQAAVAATPSLRGCWGDIRVGYRVPSTLLVADMALQHTRPDNSASQVSLTVAAAPIALLLVDDLRVFGPSAEEDGADGSGSNSVSDSDSSSISISSSSRSSSIRNSSSSSSSLYVDIAELQFAEAGWRVVWISARAFEVATATRSLKGTSLTERQQSLCDVLSKV